MCKLLTVLDIENQGLAEKFIEKSLPYMVKNDKDGLGVMRLGKNGVYINRWVTPPQKLNPPMPSLSPYSKAIEHESNIEGIPSSSYDALCVHSRQATSAVCLNNTHPFYQDHSALCHNGIVHTVDNFGKELKTTCDSEILLSRYVDHDISNNPASLTESLNGVGGYYACIVFNDSGVVDIWRDGTATLFLASVRGVGTVIATTPDIILKTCRVLKLRALSINAVLPFTHIRWVKNHAPDVRTFEKIAHVSVTKSYDSLKTFDANANKWWKDEEENPLDKIVKLKSAPGQTFVDCKHEFDRSYSPCKRCGVYPDEVGSSASGDALVGHTITL